MIQINKENLIALAGLFKQIDLIQNLAHTGKCDDHLFEIAIKSLFQTTPETAISVYENIPNLENGLRLLITTLHAPNQNLRTTLRYLFSILRIQKKISRSSKTMDLLKQRLKQVEKQIDYFHIHHPTVIANLSDAYLEIIKPFGYRFYLSGKQKALSPQENIEKIRILLLCSIRASVLWRQTGGSRLQFIFKRHQLKEAAIKLLETIPTHSS